MVICNMINKLRNGANLSQEQFAELFGISRQSVQRWEAGSSVPELDKLIKIAKYFNVSLDSLILGIDDRAIEEQQFSKEIKPNYAHMSDRESYSSNLLLEYDQSVDEGLDIGLYKDVFTAVSRLPKDEIRKKLGDVLFEIVLGAKTVDHYPYREPSDLAGIRSLRKEYPLPAKEIDEAALARKFRGAWTGRACGCLLGKPMEGIRSDELTPILKETGNYPMHRYMRGSELTEEIRSKYNFRFPYKCYPDVVDGMPVDDDINYVVLAQQIVEKYGRDFTAYDVSRAWLEYQGKDAYFTAERVAYCNFIKGFEPPESAVYQNPFRELIGAQIRGDYFGYINPGNPELAAEMAFRDASISHTKNGIYGEMFVAAMLAAAAVTKNLKDIILIGLAQIPATSRLYAAISDVVNGYENGVSKEACFRNIHQKYDEHTRLGHTHTISNAMIVAASLLYGGGDFGRSVCMSVETAFDTDCNGATVGSILGMAFGIESIGEVWTKPINDTLHTSIFGVGTVKISDCVKTTLKHIK